MNITIDKRETDITYIDKSNNQYYTNDDIIKCIDSHNSGIISVMTNIIGTCNNLNKEEVNALKTIMNNNTNKTMIEAWQSYYNRYSKSYSTFTRAINTLIKKDILYLDNSFRIFINDRYNITDNNIRHAKYLVIELYPDDTSKPITI